MTYIKPFHALCDCGVETVNIDLTVDLDEEGYVSFSTWWNQNRPWRERFRVIWAIVRGKSHYFDEVILDAEDVVRLKDYLRKLP